MAAFARPLSNGNMTLAVISGVPFCMDPWQLVSIPAEREAFVAVALELA